MDNPIKFNPSAHCTLCARQLIRDRNYSDTSATRVLTVTGVRICPRHDLAGPVPAYPVRVVEALSRPAA